MHHSNSNEHDSFLSKFGLRYNACTRINKPVFLTSKIFLEEYNYLKNLSFVMVCLLAFDTGYIFTPVVLKNEVSCWLVSLTLPVFFCNQFATGTDLHSDKSFEVLAPFMYTYKNVFIICRNFALNFTFNSYATSCIHSPAWWKWPCILSIKGSHCQMSHRRSFPSLSTLGPSLRSTYSLFDTFQCSVNSDFLNKPIPIP